MKLELKDTPGQLLGALKPISDIGGNIITIIHQRDPTSTANTLTVDVVLELPEKKLDTLIQILRDRGCGVIRIGKERLLQKQTLIMIGHLMHTDLTDTVDQIDQTGYAEVSELHMVMPAINEPSTAKMTIRAVSPEDMQRAVALLHSVSRRKNILVLEPLEGVE
ncbi:MAG: amino acid-binding protein [Methanocalculus sp. MSAO_Arc1]|uniref:amino acid-binding protein n=1 Tax=Methanocalculus TaxID=71151 RepID=UPI000FF73A5E|nr:MULTISPECIES: amino acid-binding protein [unclassified Methanocalculus]MCP1662484.1 ACT domain-containing protein [Methanocalculus sp. AMF5]RQD80854.1 MAG: amino acid-binding protein [Methanocalculus sp. MSAO_Arc1]